MAFVRAHPRVHVYAQTGIAETLIGEGAKGVVTIAGPIGANGQPGYIDTLDVARQAMAKAEAAGVTLGTVGVIAFRDPRGPGERSRSKGRAERWCAERGGAPSDLRSRVRPGLDPHPWCLPRQRPARSAHRRLRAPWARRCVGSNATSLPTPSTSGVTLLARTR